MSLVIIALMILILLIPVLRLAAAVYFMESDEVSNDNENT